MPLNFDELTRFLQALIQQPTLPAEEKPAIELAAAEMKRLGFDQLTIDKNGSLIGLIQGLKAGPRLLFDAHLDTVGVAPGVPWQHDPFAATIQNGRMYGRGSSDMKGAAAAMVHAAAAVNRATLAGQIIISLSVMEEVMEGYALKTIMDEYQPDFVVIGESTDLKLNHGGRGRVELHLEAIGRPSHSSTPYLGLNAVHLMIPAIQAIEAMPLPSDPLLGDAVIALTDIISEPYPGNSVIPSRCRVTYDRRLLAGEDAESVIDTLKNLIAIKEVTVKLGQGNYQTYTGATLQGPKFFPAWKFSPDEPFIQASLHGLQAVGLTPELGVYQFCTNAAYSAGQAQVPTIGFGPSPESMAHIVDEYIELDDLRRTAQGYQGIIERVLT